MGGVRVQEERTRARAQQAVADMQAANSVLLRMKEDERQRDLEADERIKGGACMHACKHEHTQDPPGSLIALSVGDASISKPSSAHCLAWQPPWCAVTCAPTAAHHSSCHARQ